MRGQKSAFFRNSKNIRKMHIEDLICCIKGVALLEHKTQFYIL